MIEKKANLRNIMKKFVDHLGLSPNDNQCFNKLWNNLFHNYFEYIEVSDLYRLQIRHFIMRKLIATKQGQLMKEKKPIHQLFLQ